MKKTRRILALVMSLVLLFGFAGCGLFEADPVPLAGSEPIAKGDIKVGVLHITSKEDTSGYTYAHQKGISEMQNRIGLKDEQIVIRDNVKDTDTPAITSAIEAMIGEGCDIIFATSYNYMDVVEEFAKNPDYQNIVFAHCSGYKDNDVNFVNYFGKIYEARYVSGIAAGMKAKEINEPKIGYVAAMDVTNSEVTGGINAFALGVQSVYPEATVYVKVTNDWANTKAEAEMAQALIDMGCKVIAQHCDSDAPQTTAQKNGVFGIGYNSDMTASAPKAHICAPIWNWTEYYMDAVSAVISGTWKAENYFGGMKEGFIDVSPVNEAVAAPGTADAVAKAIKAIADGELDVFKGPIIDNKGNEILAEGKVLTNEQVQTGINYYIKGVELA